MLSKRAALGLKVVTTIASAPSHKTITADALASATGVSLSYIEGILKDAREQGLIRATRGPGGGYQLVVSLDQLSVWDVVLCFNPKNTSLPKNHSSPESRATNFIAENAEQFEKEFLQNYPLAQLIPQNAVLSDSKPTKSLAMNFKPLPIRARPAAPNSIFDLSNFLNLQAA